MIVCAVADSSDPSLLRPVTLNDRTVLQAIAPTHDNEEPPTIVPRELKASLNNTGVPIEMTNSLAEKILVTDSGPTITAEDDAEIDDPKSAVLVTDNPQIFPQAS